MRRAYRRVLVATRQNVVASDRAVWPVRNVCQLQERVVVFFPHESTMPSSTSQPPSKKTRMDSDRTTRSAGSTSEPPPAAAAAAPAPAPRRNRDSDDMMEDDESEFEYDSDAIEPEGEEMEAIEIDDSDNDADAEGDTTLHGQGEMETITITDESDLDEPPPEPVSQPKGKLTSRKQFTAHIEMLVARYGAPDGEQVTGKSPPRASQAWPTRCAWLDRSFELTRAAPPRPQTSVATTSKLPSRSCTRPSPAGSSSSSTRPTSAATQIRTRSCATRPSTSGPTSRPCSQKCPSTPPTSCRGLPCNRHCVLIFFVVLVPYPQPARTLRPLASRPHRVPHLAPDPAPTRAVQRQPSLAGRRRRGRG